MHGRREDPTRGTEGALLQGIFTGSGTFRLNTGPTSYLAFSPDGGHVAAVCTTGFPGGVVS